MKNIFTLSVILISGLTLAIANPRDFPSNNSGHNNHSGGNDNPTGISSNNPSSNYNGNNYGHQNGPNNHGNYHGSNNYNNHHHGSNNYSNNYHGNHHSGNYHPSYPRPVVVYQPRPVYVSRPVFQVNVPRPRPNYNYDNTPSYQAFNFKDFLYTLKNQSFDSDKLSIARQALRNNYFDTYQIREVMSLMDFEKNRVDFAKDAYASCVDKQNYFRVNDAFQFSSSIRELDDYIFSSR